MSRHSEVPIRIRSRETTFRAVSHVLSKWEGINNTAGYFLSVYSYSTSVLERPLIMLVPAVTYAIAATSSRSLTSLALLPYSIITGGGCVTSHLHS